MHGCLVWCSLWKIPKYDSSDLFTRKLRVGNHGLWYPRVFFYAICQFKFLLFLKRRFGGRSWFKDVLVNGAIGNGIILGSVYVATATSLNPMFMYKGDL